MKNKTLAGAFILIVSGFICKFFGAFFRLPLTNIIGIEGIGAYQMIMSLYSLMLMLITGGVTQSLSKLISSARGRGQFGKIREYLRISLTITLSLGLIIGAVLFLLARNIASVQGIASISGAYRLIILLLPLGAIIGVLRGIIQGYENMTPTAISQILEQVIKFAFGLFFAYILGAERGVIGAFLGIVLGEVIAALYLIAYTIFKVKIPAASGENLTRDFLGAALPLTLGGGVLPLTHALDSLMIVPRLALAGIAAQRATALFGLQTGMVGAILNFPLVISLSVAMVVLPKLSYVVANGQVLKQKEVISKAFNLMWFLLLPLTFGIMSLARYIYPLIYPNAINGFLEEAVLLTLIGGVSVIVSAIMQFLLAVAQAKGYFLYSAIALIIGGAVKVLIVFFASSIPSINIYSLPISTLVLALFVSILLLLKLGEIVKLDAFKFLLPLVSSIIMFLGVRLFVALTSLNPLLTLASSIFLGGVIYIILNFPIIKSLIYEFFGKNKPREGNHE